ncbi:MAG: hypothetical protein ACE5IP_11640 [Terriglobia bacterium]
MIASETQPGLSRGGEKAAPSSAASSRYRTALLLFLLGAFLLTPIWLVDYPPLVDYPNLLARTFVLAHLEDPTFHFNRLYGVEWDVYPYLAFDLTLLGLQQFLPVETAGRLFLSLCVLAVPAAAWFFLRQANPGEDALAFWSLLISYNTFFLFGFLNWHLSLALCFLALGLWLRYLARPGLALWLLLLAVVTALYFTHLFGFGVAGLAMTTYGFLSRRTAREILSTWLLFLPGAVFYLHLTVGADGRWGILFSPLWEKLIGLSAVLRGYSTPLDLFSLLVLAGCFLGAWWRNPDFRWNLRWLGVATGLFALYWVFPGTYGAGADADKRLLPFLFVMALPCVKVGHRGRWLAAVALALFLVRTVNVADNFISARPQLAGLARSFSVTSPHARVLPMVELGPSRHIRRTYVHFWAYGVIQRGWLSPYLFASEGAQAFRIRAQIYSPPGFSSIYRQAPDWSRIQSEYEYVWVYDVPLLAPYLAALGDVVFEEGKLQVIRVKRP